MGTWGDGPFDNDSAADLIGEIEDGTFSFDALGWAFEADYLEVDGGQFALALVELALVALEAHDPSEELTDVDLEAFAEALTPERIAWVVAQADRTLAGRSTSELYDVRADALDEEEFAAWANSTRTAISELRELG